MIRRHRPFALCLMALCWAAAGSLFAEDPDGEVWWKNEPLPDGPTVMERMRAALPGDVVEVRGTLIPRGPAAGDVRKLDAVLVLDWHGSPARAEFEMRDAQTGEFVTSFEVERPAGGTSRYRGIDAQGSSRVVAPGESVANTAFTWADLAFEYLWWPTAVTTGAEMRRQRRCYLVDVPNPDPKAEEAFVRLWVDDSVYALLQAETRNAEGKILRELSVKSLRKMGGQWLVEDIEVRDFRNNRHTVLRIRPPNGS